MGLFVLYVGMWCMWYGVEYGMIVGAGITMGKEMGWGDDGGRDDEKCKCWKDGDCGGIKLGQ